MSIPPTVIPALEGANPQVLRDIKRASSATSVDFGFLVAQAYQESSLNPAAKATTSTATGLYQFTEGTWLREFSLHGAKYGYGALASAVSVDDVGRAHVASAAQRQQILALRNDPALSASLAAELAKENRSELQSALGRPVTSTELYLAHFLGAGGARKLLDAVASNGSVKAADLLPTAAAANPSVFYDANGTARSALDLQNYFAGRIEDRARAFANADQLNDSASRSVIAAMALQQSGMPSPLAFGMFDSASESSRRSAFGQGALDQLTLIALGAISKSYGRNALAPGQQASSAPHPTSPPVKNRTEFL